MSRLKNLISLLLVLTLVLSVASLSACEVNTSQGIYEEAIVTARTGVWRDINSGKASSATVAIMDNGKIVYSEGFGMADREKSIPVDTNTLFNIGSISKVFCAVAVMLMVDEGKVKLDTPITQYLPEFVMADKRYNDITVRMLLNHTSGVPGTTYANAEGYEYDAGYLSQVLNNLSHSNLKHDPGAMAPYSNDGFTLAEMLVERVSGMKYIDFLSERIFKPLSLSRTGLSVGEQPDKKLAVFYEAATGRREPPTVVSALGAGGLASTAEDLVRFADALSGKGKQILSQSAIEEMTRAQPSIFAREAGIEAGINPEMSYGLGLDITDLSFYREKGIKVIGKGGDTNTFHSLFLSAPDQRLSVAVIEAGQGSSAGRIAFDVFNEVLEQKGLLEKEVATVSKPVEPQQIPPQYAEFDGYYYTPQPYKISFDLKDNKVTLAVYVNGIEAQAISLFYRDGYFYDGEGNRFYFFSVDDQNYLAASVFVNVAYMVIGQKLPELDKPLSLGIQIDGKKWLRRNVTPYESITRTSSYIITSSYVDGLPGYVDFSGIKEIKLPDFAGMPSGAVRDQSELTLLDKDGQTWAQVFDMLYSPAETAALLRTGENVITISDSGYSEWLKAESDLVISFEKPSDGRVIVFSPDGSRVYDSVMDEGDVFVVEGSFIEMAGAPGDFFTVSMESED